MASRRFSLPLAIAAVGCAILIPLFVTRFALLEYFLRRTALSLVLAAAAGLACIGAGAFARDGFARLLGTRAAAGRLSSDFLVGLPLFGTLNFLAGAIAVRPWSASVLLVVGALAGAIALRRYAREAPAPPLRLGPATAVACVMTGLVILVGILNAQAPPFTLDEVAYHLAIPRTWALEGRAIELPLISHSYFPLGVESASLPFFALAGADGALASHWLHLFAAVACITLLHSIVRERTSPEMAVVIAACVATIPPLAVTTGWAWLEWPLAGIALAAFAAIDRLLADDDDAASALAAALAAGLLTKYTFGIFAVALAGAAVVAIAAVRRRRLLVAALAGGVAGSVFAARNLLLTGNPFAPFLSDLAPSVSGFRSAGGFGATLAGYLFDPKFVDESLAVTAPLLLILALAGLPLLRRVDRIVTLSMFIALGALLALTPSARILLPMIVVLAVAAGSALHTMLDGRSPAFAGYARGALLTGAALQLLLIAVYVDSYRPTDLLSGKVSEEQFLDVARRTSLPIRTANRMLPAGSRALVVGIQELFWFETPVRGGGNFDGERVSRYLEAPSPLALRERLRRDGITHVVIAGAGIAAPGSPSPEDRRERITRLSPAAYTALDGVVSGGTVIGSENGVTVFALH